MKPLNGRPKGGGRTGGRFSQLTLEGIGPRDIKPTDTHRWPEGYSPQRRAEVAARVDIKQVEGGDSSQHALHPWVDTRGGDDGPNLGQRRALAAIARSSVPAEHLQDPRTTPGTGTQNRLQVEVGGHLPGAAGWFTPQTGQVNVGDSTRKRGETETADVLLHEIGHSVSHLTTTEHSPRARWNHERETGMEHPMAASVRHGREEAFADNYAIEHRGGRRGQELPRFTSPYEQPGVLANTYHDIRQPAQADAEYSAARIPAPGAATTKIKPGMSKQWGKGVYWETPLFGRNADQFETDTQKDFGQFGWFNNTERSGGKLDSIRVGSGPPRTPVMQEGFHAPTVQTVSDTDDAAIKRRYVDAVKSGDTKEAHLISGEAKLHPIARDKARQRRGW